MPEIGSGRAGRAASEQDEILLGVLAAIDRNSEISQRTISRELGVALGLANAYLKRCVRKGWIKVQQVPRRRYAYYLTPQGFAEKTRLAGEYFSSSFNFFRRARGEMSGLIGECSRQGWKRIAFAGVSELTEVGVICAHDYPIVVVAIIDPNHIGQMFCGLPVKTGIEDCGDVDAVIVTDLTTPEQTFRVACTAVGSQRVLAPALLRIALPNNVEMAAASRAAE